MGSCTVPDTGVTAAPVAVPGCACGFVAGSVASARVVTRRSVRPSAAFRGVIDRIRAPCLLLLAGSFVQSMYRERVSGYAFAPRTVGWPGGWAMRRSYRRAGVTCAVVDL